MKYLTLLIALAVTGCSTLNDYGIGGAPRLVCTTSAAAIDDRLLGSDDMHLSLVRRFADGDALCTPTEVKAPPVRAAAAAQSERDQARQAKRHSDGRMDH